MEKSVIQKKSIEVTVKLGRTINDATREAMMMSLEERCDINFKFNDSRFEIKYLELIACLRSKAKPELQTKED